MNTTEIKDDKQKFVLKNVNFHTSNPIMLFTLNFNSRLLFIIDLIVKIIICYSSNGNLKLSNRLKVYGYYLKTLNKHNGFIIADLNGFIHIYQSTTKGWYRKILKDTNFKPGQCDILINQMDNLFISKTIDQKLKFWDRSANWQCQTIQFGSQVKSFCFNAEEDRLIVQSLDDICILQKQYNNWKIIQVFQNISGGQASLLMQDTLVVLKILKTKKGRIQIFSLNQNNDILQFTSEHHVAGSDFGYFGIDFIKETNQLFVKFGNYVTIFKINENGEFFIQSKHWFEKNCIDEYQIKVSQNGNFLALCHQTENSHFDEFYVMQIKILKSL